MTIQRIIDGVIYEFPDGTSEATIRRFEAKKTGRTVNAAPAPVTTPKADRPPPISTGLGSQFAQGVTAGTTDEILAALRSGAGTRDRGDVLKSEREALRQQSEDSPVSSVAAQTLGAAVPAAAATYGLQRLARSGRAGTASRLADLLVGRQPSIGRMAGTGALVGGATAVGTSEKEPSELMSEAVRGGAAGAALVASMAIPARYIAMPAFRRLKQSMGFGDSGRAADMLIVRALEKDGLTPDQALNRLQSVSRGEMTLADLGENTAALLRSATAAPSEGRRAAIDALTARTEGRVPRVSDDLRTLMSGSRDFYTDVQDLIRKRSSDAQRLYDAAYSAGPAFTAQNAPEIARLRNLPSFQEAMRRGQRRVADLGLNIADPRNTLRALHETKLALDDMIDTAMRGGENNQARTLINMKERLLRDMETASPEYRTARLAYAGDSEMLTAMEQGRRIYQLPEPDMRRLMDRFSGSPSEYDAFRAGIAQAMLERLRAGGGAANPAQAVFPRGTEDKIRRAFRDDTAFDEFRNRLAEESTMLNTERSAVRRTPADPDFDAASNSSIFNAAANLASGRPFSAAREALQARFPNALGMPTRISDPVIEKLLSPANRVDPVIDSIMQSLKQQEDMLMRGVFATTTGAAAMGGLAAARQPTLQYPEESLQQPGLPQAPEMGPPMPTEGPPEQPQQ